jgi:hypothetical protein
MTFNGGIWSDCQEHYTLKMQCIRIKRKICDITENFIQ